MTVQHAERVIHEKDIGIKVRGTSQCYSALLAATQIDPFFCTMQVHFSYLHNVSQPNSPPISVFKPLAIVYRSGCKAHARMTLSSREVTSPFPKSMLSSNVAL